MYSLQRSRSAPLTVAGMASSPSLLPRTKSHMHVEKQQPKPYLKPLATAVPPPVASSSSSSSSNSEREDPFNLAGFFPPSSDEKGSWGWLRAEPEPIAEEATAEASDSDEETPEEAILREDKLGILTLFAGSRSTRDDGANEDSEWLEEARLLSPYRLDPASDWDAVHGAVTGRRRGKAF